MEVRQDFGSKMVDDHEELILPDESSGIRSLIGSLFKALAFLGLVVLVIVDINVRNQAITATRDANYNNPLVEVIEEVLEPMGLGEYGEAESLDASDTGCSNSWMVRPVDETLRDPLKGIKKVFYNRVSKAGSTTTTRLLREMIHLNRGKFRSVWHTHLDWFVNEPRRYETEEERAEFVANFTALPDNTIFIKHFHYIDFEKYGAEQPAYINVIRDPIERYISRWYFSHNGFSGEHGIERDSDLQSNMTIERCHSLDTKERVKYNCVHPTGYLDFFCGQEDYCEERGLINGVIQTISQQGFEQALNNINKHYLVIGTLEDYVTTLQLFQYYMPEVFAQGDHNLVVEYLSHKDEIKAHSATSKKVETPQKFKDQLRKHYQYDYHIYEVVQQRMYEKLREFTRLKLVKSPQAT